MKVGDEVYFFGRLIEQERERKQEQGRGQKLDIVYVIRFDSIRYDMIVIRLQNFFSLLSICFVLLSVLPSPSLNDSLLLYPVYILFLPLTFAIGISHVYEQWISTIPCFKKG